MSVTAETSPSPFVRDIEPITASDDEIRRALDDAEIAPLLPALAYLTGDLTLLREDLRPDPLLFAMPQAGLSDEQAAAVRALALKTLIRYRDDGCNPAPAPSDSQLLQILEFTVGGVPMAPYLPLLEEELAYRGEDRRAPGWQLDELALGADFRVLIIGAGMSGLLTARRLQQAGVPYVIVDKNSGVGGTWWENTYPGCRVDNPNHNYSYSFAQRHDWPFHFSTQDVLHQYFEECADAFGIREHIQFSTEVLSAEWSDDDLTWSVHVQRADGTEDTLVADAVVSAVGQLNQPRYPDIEGRESFAGPAFHSARWDSSVDLVGKRVAVIGTGASAMQLIPEIAPIVGELTVFQRTPAWIAPTPDYHDPIADGLRWLYAHVPSYSEFNRFCIFWAMGDGALANVTVDPAYGPTERSVSELNDVMRLLLTEYITAEFGDRPDLLEHVVPRYPPGSKRGIRDNGVWARALKRDNVRLEPERIGAITEHGIRMADGTEHEFDVIIYGTGFNASEFLTPMRVTGRGGIELHDQWQGEARAYLGVAVPGFPNLFCLYGPNTNIVINGSIVYFSECGVRFILGLIEQALGSGKRAIEVKQDVHDEFNQQVDQANSKMAWGFSTVSSWYKNDSGRVAQNWPFTLLEYWQRTLRPDPAEFHLLG